jgi:para-nitrobenzyl esterase
VVDGDSLPRDPFSPDAPDVSADVPLLLGANETEATFFPNCPLDPIDDETLVGALTGFTQLARGEIERLVGLYREAHPGKDQAYLFQLIASDWWLGADAVAEAERKAGQGRAPAYLYYFAKHSPARGGRLRAVHTLEIPYVFDNLALAEPLTGPATPENQALADLMSRAWTNFARTGDPNGPGVPDWPPYTAAERRVMVFADRSGAVADPYPGLRQALAELKAGAAQA